MSAKSPETRRARFPFDAIVLDDNGSEPITDQLEQQIKAAILERRLKPGDRLPSTRQLSSDLTVARNTLKNAYSQLIAEGYLIAAAGSGTRVADEIPDRVLQPFTPRRKHKSASSPTKVSSAAKRIQSFQPWIETNTNRPVRPFLPHTPSNADFPSEVWAKLTARRLRQSAGGLLDRGDPRGFRPLREAIADYLGSARGMSCHADQVFITAGAQQGIDLLTKLLVDPGDRVCMEDPCYMPAKFVFELANAKVVTVPVDDQGISVKRLYEKAPSAKLAYVTPSSQFPTTATMQLSRRLSLIEWARDSGAMIIEDDYNGEFRFRGRPLPALYGIVPETQCVIYMGSFSKLLFPSLRIGYLVVPDDLIDPLASSRWLIDRHSPLLEQAVLTDFVDEGHFARHVRRMRIIYAERQTTLVQAATDHLSDVLEVSPADGGLHLVGRLNTRVREKELMRAAMAARVELTPMSQFCVRETDTNGVILGFAPFSNTQIRRAAKQLAAACKGMQSQLDRQMP